MIINLIQLFQDTHGYSPRAAAFEFTQALPSERYSKYGIPLYGIAPDGREYFLPTTINGEDIGFNLISITGKKKIIETDLTERRGTVKEIISIQDYTIDIKGLIIGSHDNDFMTVEKKMGVIRTLFDLNESVELVNALTDIVLISAGQKRDKIVIESLSFPETKGVKHVRGYAMTMISDSVFELEEQP